MHSEWNEPDISATLAPWRPFLPVLALMAASVVLGLGLGWLLWG